MVRNIKSNSTRKHHAFAVLAAGVLVLTASRGTLAAETSHGASGQAGAVALGSKPGDGSGSVSTIELGSKLGVSVGSNRGV
jgi:hypothetical protein